MPAADLQFEHAVYDESPGGVMCAQCKRPAGAEYWHWLGRVVCTRCAANLRQLETNVRSPQVFARAALLGLGTALGCGVAYAVFVALAKSQWALVTIGIAYVVATVLRKATGNISGRQYQVLAVALTYVASAMGYLSYIVDPRTLLQPGFLVGDGPRLFAYLMAAPVLAARSSPLSLLIIGLGLFEAWRRAAPIPMVITGPYRVPAAMPAPPAPSAAP